MQRFFLLDFFANRFSKFLDHKINLVRLFFNNFMECEFLILFDKIISWKIIKYLSELNERKIGINFNR